MCFPEPIALANSGDLHFTTIDNDKSSSIVTKSNDDLCFSKPKAELVVIGNDGDFLHIPELVVTDNGGDLRFPEPVEAANSVYLPCVVIHIDKVLYFSPESVVTKDTVDGDSCHGLWGL